MVAAVSTELELELGPSFQNPRPSGSVVCEILRRWDQVVDALLPREEVARSDRLRREPTAVLRKLAREVVRGKRAC